MADTTAAENISKEVLTKLEALAQSMGTAVENLYSKVVEDMVVSNTIGAYICTGLGLILLAIVGYCLVSMWKNGEDRGEDWWTARVVPTIICGILLIIDICVGVSYWIDACRPHAEALEFFKGLI